LNSRLPLSDAYWSHTSLAISNYHRSAKGLIQREAKARFEYDGYNLFETRAKVNPLEYLRYLVLVDRKLSRNFVPINNGLELLINGF